MEEFTQSQAAMLSGYDERSFRSLLDKRIILASPATRNTGRGKAKTFLRPEVRVASVLNRLDRGLSVFQQAGVADWLREHLASYARSNHDAYALVSPSERDEGWKGWIHYVSDQNTIPVTWGLGEEQLTLRTFVAASIKDALFWDDEEILKRIFGDAAQPKDTE